MARLITASIAAAVAASVGACGEGAPRRSERAAAIQLALGNEFTGKYLRMWGERTPAADPVYPCVNAFEVCVPLDAAGATSPIRDLCPSDDLPQGTWSYRGIVYADAGCTQPLSNFGCLPDEGEWIAPGANRDDIQCITRNADKSFDFCVIDPVTGAGTEACPPEILCKRNPACGAPNGPQQLALVHSNVTELDMKLAIPVSVELDAGNTRVTIGVTSEWPIVNGFLGYDHFAYNASWIDHPVVRIADEGCDELVVAGQACGWQVNFNGTTADGFGTFASRSNREPAGRGASTQPLVFWLQGDAAVVPNGNGARLVLHGRFEGLGAAASCSAWFSDGTSVAVGSEAGCVEQPQPYCRCP